MTASPGRSARPVQVTWRPYKNSGSSGIVSRVRTTCPSASIAPAQGGAGWTGYHEAVVGQEMLRALLRVLADVVEEPEVAAGPETEAPGGIAQGQLDGRRDGQGAGGNDAQALVIVAQERPSRSFPRL